MVIIGNANVGKTTIAQKWLYGDYNYDDIFEYGYSSRKEIEIKFPATATKNRDESESKKYGICLWDTRGSPTFHALTKVYARNANAIIFVYDITDKASFYELSQWIEEVDEANDYPTNVMKVLIANKYDLYVPEHDEDDEVELDLFDESKTWLKQEEMALAKKYDIKKIWHISALEDNKYVLDDIFNDITKLILANNDLCIKRRQYPFFG